MLLSLYRMFSGYLDVTITGVAPERLVNLAVQAGMDLWDLRRHQGGVTGRLLLADFWRIRPLARAARCRVQIRHRWGGPFLARRLRSRWALLAGAIFSLAMLVWFTSHIWVIQVRGAEMVDARAVRAGAAQLGLRPGAVRWRVDLQRVEAGLPQLVPDLGWVTVRARGTRAVVEVVERKVERRLPAGGRVDVVAAKPCVLDSVVAFWGLARARPGQVLEPGDTLIEGIFYRHSQPPLRTPYTKPENWPPPPDLAEGLGRAQGVAFGRCFYQHYVEVPLQVEERVPTGRNTTRVVLQAGKREILLKGDRREPYAAFDSQVHVTRLPGWRNWVPPVEVRTDSFTEVIIRQIPQDLAAAGEEAMQRLLERVRWQLTPGIDKITAQRIEELVRTPAYVGLRLTVETREQIGRPRPVAEGIPAAPAP